MSTENSYDHPKNMRLMLRLGIVSPTTDTFDMFLAWGRLIDAREIWEKGKAMIGGAGMFPPIADIVAEFSPAEKIALRDRICGVAEMPERG